jgi:hypothetical protein
MADDLNLPIPHLGESRALASRTHRKERELTRGLRSSQWRAYTPGARTNEKLGGLGRSGECVLRRRQVKAE